MSATGIAATVERLMELRAAHQRRLEENEDFKAVRTLTAAINAMLPAGATDALRSVVTNGSAPVVAPAPADTHTISQGAAAVKALENRGLPMPTRPLLEAIITLGAKAGGKDPVSNLVSVLSRNERIKSVIWNGQNAWWLADREVPSRPSDGH